MILLNMNAVNKDNTIDIERVKYNIFSVSVIISCNLFDLL